MCQFLENNQQQVNLLDKAVLEIGAGTGLLSIVACLLGESISGVSNLSDTERQADHVFPHIIPNEQMPAGQRDPGLCACSAERSLLIFEPRHLAVNAKCRMPFFSKRAELNTTISLIPPLTLLTRLCDAGMSFILGSADLSGMLSKQAPAQRQKRQITTVM